MRILNSARWVSVVVGLSVLALAGAPSRAEAAACGPGADWVDNCPSGTDSFQSTAQHGTVIFDPEDGGAVINLPLMTGITKVFRGPGTPGSTAGGDSHIVTEMVSLSLSGGGLTLIAGDGIGNLSSDGPLFSPGRIDEIGPPITGGTLGHSFFDIFFEISPTPFGPLHNTAPCVMATDITQVPPLPGTTYDGCDADRRVHVAGDPLTLDVIDLFDASGVHRAILTGGVAHTVGLQINSVPEPSSLVLLGAGVLAVGAMTRRIRRK